MKHHEKLPHTYKYTKYKIVLLLISILFSIFITSCTTISQSNNNVHNNDTSILKVHYIDVSQGDSILIQVNGKNMLIDSGPKSEKQKIKKYLDSLKINKFDYVIASHPHEDHIGNMSYIINKYDISKFYAPKVISTSKIFEDMIDNLKDKNLKINVIKEGTDSIDLGPDTTVKVFSPCSKKYDDLNNYSPVIKITYKNNSFLFAADAEKLSENEILNKKYDLRSDVLKIGHHGSTSSTSDKFLDAINPSIAIIMVGKDNDYGHPNKETITKLEKRNIKIYRTDLDGNIVLSSDGNTIR